MNDGSGHTIEASVEAASCAIFVVDKECEIDATID